MHTIRILGIDFFNGTVEESIEILKKGGLAVFPSGPGLATVNKDDVYYKSLQESTLVITDSGYMVLLWRVFHFVRLKRTSGLKFLKAFLSDKEVMSKKMFLVNPTPKEEAANYNYLTNNGFTKLTKEDSYIAPFYKSLVVEDANLLSILEQKKPDFILINIGGGIQEKLGYYLLKNLSYKPGIICTGAAIAFLTGNQANIPDWADYLFLGWLFRCIQNPKLYIPRYINSFKLIFLLMKYKDKVVDAE